MAVYTEVSFAEADALVQRLGLGALTELQGITSGIENTNYYATTARGQWVLTLFERLAPTELPYYLALMQHLAQRGIPVPAPQPAADGSLVHTVAGKPASVVTRLPGGHRLAPGVDHCRQVGRMLARMHVAGASLPVAQPHLRGLAWWAETVPVVLPHLQPAQASLLVDELAFQQELADSALGQSLPKGSIHADLFRDNVMFDDTAGPDTLCGFFDFYFAGTGPARAAARRGAALLDQPPVGLAPAAPGRAAGTQGPHALRARAAPAHRQPLAPATLNAACR